MTAVRISESDWQSWVTDVATAHGWIYHHGRPARTKDGWRTAISGLAGFPDLVLVHAGRRLTLFVELKANGGSCSANQVTWIDTLERAGAHVFVWRPIDRDLVQDILTGRAER